MKIQITAGGIYNAKGEEIPVGTELTVKAEPTAWKGRYTVVSKGGEGKTALTTPATPAPTPTPTPTPEPEGGDQTGPQFVPPVGPFEAKERSGGWWAIYDGNGEVVGKSVRKNDLEGFDSLSDEDKLAFATEHARAAFEAENKG